ncbi:Carbamoyl-phosphate synthase large chain [Frankliniella fusca]|uniref:Carbamoyl-phosphate synthase large chain n=1 Tax=Frankliniella fusca TaxID=407009 RepID=A0AAE1HFS1_9NEOP|nr:Carbamoyl-phosphate synthase large chain [Frankliniella fusca]
MALMYMLYLIINVGEKVSQDGNKSKATQTIRHVINLGTQTIEKYPTACDHEAVPVPLTVKPILRFEKCRKNKKFKFFTGLSVEDFEILFSLLGGDCVIRRLRQKFTLSDFTPKASKYSGRDRLFYFLLRLRRGLPLEDLAEIANISVPYLDDLLYIMTRHIYLVFKSMENRMFPTAAEQAKNKPKPFRPFPNLRVILDSAQFFIQMPTNFEQQGNTYSSYKHHNTVIVVIGISCQGAVIHVSPVFEGNISDKGIVRESGLLQRLSEGDAVMTDRGFDIEGELLDIGVRLYKPPSLGDRNKLTAEEEILTKAIASARIYVEHIIADIKDNRLLQGVIPILLSPVIPDLIFIAGYLCNFKKSRISQIKNRTQVENQ